MVDEPTRSAIVKYLKEVNRAGIQSRCDILFGSHARGTATEWSDIDLVVIAPELDHLAGPGLIDKLWELRANTDSRIEPVPCGEKEWEEGTERPIIEIARREGLVITL